MIDSISDMITRIRNANIAKNNSTLLRYNKITLSIIEILIAEKYLKNNYSIEYSKKKQSVQIRIFLNYRGFWLKKSIFSIFKRVSKPGKRIFASYKEFEKKIAILKYKENLAIISTSSGLMSHTKAQKIKKGGEILCYIG